MSDAEPTLGFAAVIVTIGGRARRIETGRKLRTAIVKRDIGRHTKIAIEQASGAVVETTACLEPDLAKLFDEILGTEVADESAVGALASDGNAELTREGIPDLARLPANEAGTYTATQLDDSAGVPSIGVEEPPPSRAVDRAFETPASTPAAISAPEPTRYHAREQRPRWGVLTGFGAAFCALVAVIVHWTGEPVEVASTDTMEPIPTVKTKAESRVDLPRPTETAEDSLPEPERSPDKQEYPPPKPVSKPKGLPPVPEAEPSPEPAPSLARAAVPADQGRWGRRIADNYPSQALRQEIEGSVRVAVTVDSNGRASECAVTSSSGSAILDEAACNGMRRYGRFSPALDANGNATVGYYSTSVVYKLD